MTFSLGGLTGYQVQYWNGSGWATISGGTISSNDRVWRKITFTPLTTTRIRVLANASPDNYSRLVEVEAWTGPSPAPRYNLALAARGSVASASNSYNAGYGPAGTNNGDRKSLNWTNGGGWNDSGPPFPDWLQIDFGSVKTIDEVDVFTLQDNYANSAEPTESMIFSLWGLTSYEVQYWNGSTWVTVPNGSLSGNNKIWRKFTFSPIVTSKIRVLTIASVDGYSRITEVEAYAPQESSCGEISRLDPLNATGGGRENPLSQNFNWNLPLVTLPGRAGMDLGLTLSYNSLVWSRNNSTISFDEDNGFPSPGFRLGFPVIQPLHYNPQTGKQGFILIGSDGSRTELRQVDSSLLFEAADSSHLLLDANEMKLRHTDGTEMTYVLLGGEFKCTQIKDRNGNYITIDYVSGRLDKVIDTLGRQIRFNYNSNGLLTSITQTWNQGLSNQVEHPWARFTYLDTTIQTNFPGLTVNGPANNSSIKTLSSVTLADNSHYDFAHTGWGQVWKISYITADGGVVNYRAYKLPGSPLLPTSAQADCPRFTERRDWATYWNGDVNGTISSAEDAVTAFSGPIPDTWTMPGESQPLSGRRTEVTQPDGTVNKIYFVDMAGTPRWRRGLPALVETSSGGNWQRKVKTTWTQDNTNVDYLLNPRVLETNVYDPAGNRARTAIAYQHFTFANNLSCWLPRDVFEYAADASTVLRTTRTTYNNSSDYTNRRILGLPSQKLLYEGDVNAITPTLVSKLEFNYDESDSIQENDPPVQHDASYSSSFVTGRANLSSVKRYNVNNSESTTTSTKYNTAGAIVSSKDASNHSIQISYTESFSDGNNSRNTLAYPTTVTDPDGYSSRANYNFDFGAITYQRTPRPNITNPNDATPGPEQTFTFDSIGRLQQITNLTNNAYTRFLYSTTQLRLDTYATIQDGLGEAHSFRITDGAGRLIASVLQHPGSDGGYSAQRMVYDVMGRVFKTSNPTETDVVGATPFNWEVRGDDVSAGWIFSEQTYDWKGRPLVTTNPSLTNNPAETTTRTASYAGCGCAGGQVVTLTDEGTKVGVDTKKRQRKIYSDVLGRVVKTEILNWDGAGPNGTGGTVYSTITTTYNARDQVTLVRKYAGTSSSTTFQDTIISYDGFGRLKSQHSPNQKVDPNNSASSDHTTWNYYSDDTIQSVVDARGVIANFSYNGRHLVSTISYDASNLPAGANVAATTSVAFTYDAAGNRKSMSDGSGTATYHYDQLSRMDWEERTFSGLPNAGTFRLSYEYSIGGVLKRVTDERSGTSFTETLDKTGRVTAVNAVGFQGAQTQFASQIQYRAGGQLKSRTQGNTTLSFDYNSRGLVKAYSLTGHVNASYTYHQDGMIKLAQNGEPIKDRAYSYDVAHRLQAAYSGVEARQYVDNGSAGTADGPYRHNYTYDNWDNQTAVDSRFWTRDADTFLTFDANNRVSGWSYDAEGNVLSRNEPAGFPPFESAHYNFDAAGREIGSTQKRSSFLIEEGTGYTLTNDFVNTRKHDGDGQVVDYSVLRHLYVNTHFSTTFGGRTFLLRSTVLGGKTISEYDDTATWMTTHVFVAEERIGQVGPSGAPAVLWHNWDPITGDLVDTLSNGSLWARTTLDSGGANLGDVDPFPPDGSADPDGLLPEAPGGKSVPGILGSGGGRSKCVLDGIEVECSFIRDENSVQCPDNDCGPRWNPSANNPDGSRGAFEHFQAFVNGYAGYMTQYGRYHYDSGSKFSNSPYEEEVPTGVLGMGQTKTGQKTGTKNAPHVIHKEVLKNALADCINELYPMFKMVSYKPTRTPLDGKDDSYNGIIWIKGQTGSSFPIISDPSPPEYMIKNMKSVNARGATSNFGNPTGDNPFWTYSCPSCDLSSGDNYGRPAEARYPELFRGMTSHERVQIHELGTALTMIRNAYYPPPAVLVNGYPPLEDNGLYKDGHDDDGPAMEDCVGRKYYNITGLKPRN
ncbi:MAG TPA: discoidin domain-containing protein [Pyrinomonadaceae bacterium]|nr:discoidin domain-containing protein [Pyrinomonadaceae bacterium]